MKLLLIDDQTLFREGCALLIQQTWPRLQVHHAASLSEARDVLNRHPDICVVLLDLHLPDGSGAANVEQLMNTAEAPAYVVLPERSDPALIDAVMDIGAVAAVPKTARTHEFIEVLAAVIDNALPQGPAGGASLAVDDLSPRQIEVLRHLIDGRTNKEICRALGLSPSTVKTHVTAIFQKLGAATRTQAVTIATRLGLGKEPTRSGQ